MWRVGRVLVGFLLAVLLLGVANTPGTFSPIEVAAAPYRFGLVRWELANVPDKWWHKLVDLMPWSSSKGLEERRSEVLEFFRLGEEIHSLEDKIDRRVSQESRPNVDVPLSSLRQGLEELKSRERRMSASVQESLESEISAVLAREGLSSRLGLVFPMVDLVLSDAPKLLVVSPRDRIQRTKSVLLRPEMAVEEMEDLEDEVLQRQDMAALVVQTGGVATYPSIVPGRRGLLRAANTGAHEWLHQFWFFRPLGSHYNSGPEMRTLNESAADLAGEEIGRAVYEAITGEKLVRPDASPDGNETDPDPDMFSFRAEMQKTRRRVDELLGEGRIEDAEADMETRRQLFAKHGFYIRKLNQAYFAFHGTYASNPASVSPIQGQLELLRANVDSVGELVRLVARFSSYSEFQAYISGLPEAP